jgi:hypothetical protein
LDLDERADPAVLADAAPVNVDEVGVGDDDGRLDFGIVDGHGSLATEVARRRGVKALLRELSLPRGGT